MVDELRVAGGGIDVGGDVDRAPPVDAPDRFVATPVCHVGHFGERHLDAAGHSDAHVIEVGQAAAFVAGITEHDFDIVASALDALHFVAIKRLAHLPREVGLRQAKRLGFRRDFQQKFLFSLAERVGDVDDAVELAEPLLEPLGGGLQLAKVCTGDHNIDRVAGLKNICSELQLLDFRHLADDLTPAPRDLVAVEHPLLGRGGLDVHLAGVRTLDGGYSAAAGSVLIGLERLAAHGAERVTHDAGIALRRLRVELVANFFGGDLELLHDALGFLRGAAQRQDHSRGDIIALHRREKREANMPTCHDAHCDGERRHRDGHRQVTPIKTPTQRRLVDSQDELVHPSDEPVLKPAPPADEARAVLNVVHLAQIAQMLGQDE